VVLFRFASPEDQLQMKAILTGSLGRRKIDHNPFLIFRYPMRGKSTRRTIRRTRHWLMVWALMPVVVLSDHAIYGCVAASGKISTTCRCCAAKGVGNCSCCIAKMHSSSVARNVPGPTGGEQIAADHCRAVAVYSVAQAISAPERSNCVCLCHTALLSLLPSTVLGTGEFMALELNTGPAEPLQLLTQLHRWII